MTTLTLNGRDLLVWGSVVANEVQGPGPTSRMETLLDSVTVEDAITGADVTDEFEDHQQVIEAAWEAAERMDDDGE